MRLRLDEDHNAPLPATMPTLVAPGLQVNLPQAVDGVQSPMQTEMLPNSKQASEEATMAAGATMSKGTKR